MKKTTRRDVLGTGLVAVGGAFGVGASVLVAGKPQPTSSLGQYEADITSYDRRFRFAFNRTLFRLRLRGRITRQQFRDFRAASFSTFEYRHKIGRASCRERV